MAKGVNITVDGQQEVPGLFVNRRAGSRCHGCHSPRIVHGPEAGRDDREDRFAYCEAGPRFIDDDEAILVRAGNEPDRRLHGPVGRIRAAGIGNGEEDVDCCTCLRTDVESIAVEVNLEVFRLVTGVVIDRDRQG